VRKRFDQLQDLPDHTNRVIRIERIKGGRFIFRGMESYQIPERFGDTAFKKNKALAIDYGETT
jgi:hypothetical protein